MPGSVIAAQLYTVRDFTKTPADITATMKKVARIGYEAVQLSALGPMEPKELRAVCDGEGLKICATHIGYEQMRDQPQAVIDLHHTYGCPYAGIGGLPGAYRNAEGFAKFERDLLDCLIPAVQAKYSASTNREQRALAGLSMGGGQSLNFGLKHLDTFAWVGGFSSAPNTKPSAELVPDPAAVRARLKLLYLSCGKKDGLISVSQGVHTYLKQQNIPHIWNVDDHGHAGETWGSNLYHFAQRLFIATKHK